MIIRGILALSALLLFSHLSLETADAREPRVKPRSVAPKKVSLACAETVQTLLNYLRTQDSVDLSKFQEALAKLQGRSRSRGRVALTDDEVALLNEVKKVVDTIPLEQLDPHLSYRGIEDWTPGAALRAAEVRRDNAKALSELLKAEDLFVWGVGHDDDSLEWLSAIYDTNPLFMKEWDELSGGQKLERSAIAHILVNGGDFDLADLNEQSWDEAKNNIQISVVLRNGQIIDRFAPDFPASPEAEGLYRDRLITQAGEWRHQRDLQEAFDAARGVHSPLSDSPLELVRRSNQSLLIRSSREINRLKKHEKRAREIIFERILNSYGIREEYVLRAEAVAAQSGGRTPKQEEAYQAHRRAARLLASFESGLGADDREALLRLRGTRNLKDIELTPADQNLLRGAAAAIVEFQPENRLRFIDHWISNSAEAGNRFLNGQDEEQKYVRTSRGLRQNGLAYRLTSSTGVAIEGMIPAQMSSRKALEARELRKDIIGAITQGRSTADPVAMAFRMGSYSLSDLNQAFKNADIDKKDLMVLMPLYKHLLHTVEAQNNAEAKMSRDELARKRLASWIVDGNETLIPAVSQKLKYLHKRYWTLDRRLRAVVGRPLAWGARTGLGVVNATTVRPTTWFLTRRTQNGWIIPRPTTTVAGIAALTTVLGLHRAHHEGIEWAPSVEQQAEFFSTQWGSLGDWVAPYASQAWGYAQQGWGLAGDQFERIPFDQIPSEIYANSAYDFTNYPSELRQMPYVSWPVENAVSPGWDFLVENLSAQGPTLEQAWDNTIIFIGSQSERGLNWVEEVGPSSSDNAEDSGS